MELENQYLKMGMVTLLWEDNCCFRPREGQAVTIAGAHSAAMRHTALAKGQAHMYVSKALFMETGGGVRYHQPSLVCRLLAKTCEGF